jgi:hypothetical protein
VGAADADWRAGCAAGGDGMRGGGEGGKERGRESERERWRDGERERESAIMRMGFYDS